MPRFARDLGRSENTVWGHSPKSRFWLVPQICCNAKWSWALQGAVSRRVICKRAAPPSAWLLLWKTFLSHTRCSAEWAHTNLAAWTWSLLSHSGYAEARSLMMGVQVLTWAGKHLCTVLEFLGKEIFLVFHASFFSFLWLLQVSWQLQKFSSALKTGCLMQQSEWNGFPSDSAITHQLHGCMLALPCCEGGESQMHAGLPMVAPPRVLPK